ncbi:unnamed protein product [Adineta steineri]|uniref:Uncharacterized protein n=1 Tax=Adineta steineri TaxID=433720 RepID=A0A818IF29_9BILA|nr:unnamed protein product [Adineta steineri]CAF0746000.1 unnamed protein product [Adineta steineri]CAF3488208.1 unnamed protein product [Adineta steineri]CAF3521488.1 unnamed protein product [Adineta steineri]
MSYEEASSASFFQSSSGGNGLNGSEFGGSLGGGLEGGAQEGYSSYQSSSSAGYGNGEALLSNGGSANNGFFSSSSSSFSGLGGGSQTSANGLDAGFAQQSHIGVSSASDSGFGSGNYEQRSTALTTYATDAQGLFKDPNPEIVRRPAPGGQQTYTQRVIVKFLQPPPVPPPGPLIIKEVRPPQPPPPPPLYIRQRPPPPPTLPPIVIREAPPKVPAAVGTQIITKMLPPLPTPPRSVIIERLPPVPPRPRDVIVERWLPYRHTQKRRVIIQRAPPPVLQKPRNIIIYYEAPKAQVVRRFQNLGVQRANPADYVARYGAQLEDSQTLISHARQAGVVEDISPPAGAATSFESSNFESFQSSGGSIGAAGFDFNSASSNGLSAVGGGIGLESINGGGELASSSYEASSSYSTNAGGTGGYGGGLEASFGGLGIVDNANANGIGGGSSSYESYSSQQTFTQ